MSAKRNDTRERRLAALIAGCEAGERLVEITGEARRRPADAPAGISAGQPRRPIAVPEAGP